MGDRRGSQSFGNLLRAIVSALLLCLASALLPPAMAQEHEENCPDEDQPDEPITCPDGPFGVPGLNSPPSEIGQWGPLNPWPIQATHSTLLSSGKVLFWRGRSPFGSPTLTYVWDPETETLDVTAWTSSTDLFCAGHALLPDGRVLAVGGTLEINAWGSAETNIYDPETNTWTRAASMELGRYYPTVTTLPDGRAIAVAGDVKPRDESGPQIQVKIPEVYDAAIDTWEKLAAAELELPWYPFNFVLPNGKIFYAGPNREGTSYLLNVETETWEFVATRDFVGGRGGSAAMYRAGKILGLHGNSAGVEAINLVKDQPQWRRVDPMNYSRRRMDLTLLPDGTALVVGGFVPGATQGTLECAVHAAELWDPETETWTTLASMERSRQYHSTALLLPDARVLVAGGESEVGGEESYEIYSPPYLFKGPRPTIASAPSSLVEAQLFTVETPDADSIRSVALLRLGSVTHQINQNQRYVPLAFQAGNGRLSVVAPQHGSVAPPGDYMLFLVNNNGAPSVAHFVR